MGRQKIRRYCQGRSLDGLRVIRGSIFNTHAEGEPSCEALTSSIGASGDTVKLKQYFKSHYTQSLPDTMKRFKVGLVLFGVGLSMVIFANVEMAPSLQQELVVLLGLVLLGVGFLVALLAHIRLLIGRIILFFESK